MLTARKNRAGWALQTKGEDKGPFLRAELALPPYICSGIWFGNIKSDPMPIEISEKIPADFGRPSRGWGAANPASHKQLAPHQPAVWDDGHTLCLTHTTHVPHTPGQHRAGQTLFTWARETGLTWTEPGSREVGSKSFFLDYRNIVTKLRLPKDCRIRCFLLLLSFLSLDSQGSEPVTRGLACWWGPPARAPLSPILCISPLHLLRFTLGPASSLETLNGP